MDDFFPADASHETALRNQTVGRNQNISLVVNDFQENVALGFVCRCFLTDVGGKYAVFISDRAEKDE